MANKYFPHRTKLPIKLDHDESQQTQKKSVQSQRNQIQENHQLQPEPANIKNEPPSDFNLFQ